MIEEKEVETIINELSARQNDGESDRNSTDTPDWFLGYQQGLGEAIDELDALLEE